MQKLQSLKVLLIEDNPGDVLLLRAALEADHLTTFELTAVETLADGLNQIQRVAFDIVLVDLGLPDSAGLQTFECIHQATSALPVVVFSGNEDEQQAIDTVRAGAQDYLVKSLSGFDMAARTIRYAIERQQALEKMLESEERLNLVMAGSQLGYWDWDIQTGKVHRNTRWAEMLGYTLDEVEQTVNQWTDLHHPDDREAAWASIQDHLEGRTPSHRMEYRMLAKDGRYKWILDQASVVKRDAQGKPLRMCGTHTDITERKQAENSIHLAEQQYRLLFEESPVMVVLTELTDTDILIAKCNQKFLSTLGYDQNEVIGKSLSGFYSVDSRAKLEQSYPDTITGILLSEERELITHDGRIIPVLLRAVPRANAEGTVIGTQASYIDITERKRAEKEVREARELFQTLFTLSPVAYSFTKISARILVDVNTAWENLFGYTREEVAGKSSTNFNFWANLEEREPAFEKLVREGRLEGFEFAYRKKSGQTGWTTIHAAIIEQGGEKFILSEFVETTERRQAELALKANEENYRNLVENSESAIAVLDRQGKILYSNPRGIQIWQDSQVVGKTIFDVYPRDYANRYLSVVQSVIDTGTAVLDEIESPVGGRMTWFRINMTALKNPDGTVTSLVLNAWDITERKLAEINLLEKLKLQEQLEKTASIVPGMIHIFKQDAAGEFSMPYASMAIKDVYGLNVSDVTEDMTPVFSRIDPQDTPHVQATIAESARSMTPWREELRYHHPGKGLRWLEGHSTPVAEPDGSILWYGLIQDITERKQVEESLRRNEHLLRLFVEHSPAAIAMFDNDMRYIVASHRFLQDYGLDEQDLTGRSHYEVFPEVSERWKEIHRRCLNGAIERADEDPFPRADGSLDWVRWEIRPWYEQEGKIGGIILFSEKITERKQAEQKLRESEERLRLALKTTSDGFWIVGADRRFMDVNEAYCAMSGYTREELLQLSIPDIEVIESVEDTQNRIRKIMETGRDHFETHHRRKDGNVFDVDVMVNVLDQENGLLVCFCRDITTRKQADTLLKQRMEDLALINKLNDAVNRGESLVEITELLAQDAKEIFGSQSVSIYLLDADKKHLVLQHYTMSREIIARLEKLIGRPVPQVDLPVGGDDHFSRALESEDGFLITGFENVCAWLADFSNTSFLPIKVRPLIRKLIPAAVKLLNINSVVSIPLKSAGEVIGLVEFIPEGAFDEATFERLQNVRHQLAEVVIRKRTEQSLHESEKKYRLLSEELEERVKQRTAEVQDLYDNAPTAYHSLDANGYVVQINQTELNWLGYSREEMLGRSFSDFINVDSLKVFETNFPEFKKRGWLRDLEFEMVRKDGSILPVSLSATAIRDEAGNFVMGRSTLFDITERKKADEALRESRENLQYFFDSASDLIQSVDDNGNYLYVNAAWCRTLGYTAKEALQTSMMNIIDPAHQEHCQALLKSLVIDQHPQQLEVTFRNKAGEAVIVEGSVSSRKDKNGHIATNGIFRNITERKRAEESLRESYDQLSIANIALENAMRVKDEFLASMSHELRTPLTGILGLSEAMQANTYGELNDKQKKILNSIHDSGEHLLTLINDILDLSKIEAGKLEIETSPSLLSDICQASLQLTKGMAHQKHQHVKYSAPVEPILLDVDARRVKQIIVNLLSNAIKFTPENGELGLDVEPDEANRQVRLVVWDKGIGIKPENLSKLFQPFTQIDSSLAREYSGTGLGLSLVKRLVELHNGNVTVESVFGKGSRFIVSLPWTPQTMGVGPSAVGGREDSYFETIDENSSSPMILVTDDNLVLLDMLTDFLEAKKYRTAKAQSGKELLEKIESIKPDVILMDIQMPGMDGLETIRRVRNHKDAAIASTLIIAITALAMPSDRERCLQAGANEYMSKPITLVQLTERISEFLKEK